MNLASAATVLERRRNYLRAIIAIEGDEAHDWDRTEAGALDEVLVALYDVKTVRRKPGVESKFRSHRYVREGQE